MLKSTPHMQGFHTYTMSTVRPYPESICLDKTGGPTIH